MGKRQGIVYFKPNILKRVTMLRPTAGPRPALQAEYCQDLGRGDLQQQKAAVFI